MRYSACVECNEIQLRGCVGGTRSDKREHQEVQGNGETPRERPKSSSHMLLLVSSARYSRKSGPTMRTGPFGASSCAIIQSNL